MKKEKGNVAVISIIIVIVAITAGVVGWLFAKKTQAPAIKQMTNQSTAPVTLEPPTQIKQTPHSSQSSFKADEKGNFYGEIIVTGYPIVKSRPEPFCEENCKSYPYVIFQVVTADNNALFDFLETWGPTEESFIGNKQVGLGCLQGEIIAYSNSSDKFGMKEYSVSAELSKSILESSNKNPVTIKLERLLFTLGSGAPACYSHFTYVTALK